MRPKKIIAIGLSMGMMLNLMSVSAVECVVIDEQNEDIGGISVQSETEIENEDLGTSAQSEIIVEDENFTQSRETTDSENLDEISVELESVIENEKLEEVSAQSETVIASGKCGENITFKLTGDGVLTLSGSGAMPALEYDWKSYQPICGWGDYISSIKRIIIEDGITSISQYSFYDCENLTEVSIPSSIKAIGYEAFHWCHNITKVMIDGLDSWCDIDFDEENANPLQFGADLYINGVKQTQIKIPEGITEIKPYVFSRNWNNNESKASITSILLPDTVTTIGENAFAYNYLQSINIPDSVLTIGTEAFAGNDFSTIEISENVNVIDDGVFRDCRRLQNIKIPNAARKLGEGLFVNCIKLANVELPEKIETIPATMFAGCTSLTQFKVPDTVQSIASSAFAKCSNLVNIELSNQIHTIGDYAFSECSGLREINLPMELECIGDSAFMGCKALEEVDIPGKVTSIGAQAFRQCEALAKIIIPNTVTGIGEAAFFGCTMLEQFKIPENTGMIQNYTFYGCTKLSSVTFAENLTAVGESAFQNCVALNNMVIPASVVDIGKRAFSGCEKMESVILPSQISKIADYTFSGCKNLKMVQLSDGMTTIGAYAFENCNSLSEITIPETIVEIQDFAFTNCAAVNRIDFKGDAPQIGTNAFTGVTATCYYPADNASYTPEITTQDFGGNLIWTYEGKTEEEDKCGENLTWKLAEDGKLVITGTGRMFDYSIADYQYAPWYEQRTEITSIEIDNNVTYIGNYAFYRCNKVSDEKTELPEKLEEIGEGAFRNCSIKSVDIPLLVKCVGKEAFAWSGLVSVSLPASLQALPENMFADSHHLKNVAFSKGLKEIGKKAFASCFELNSVDIPEGVISIGDEAFLACGACKTYGMYYDCYNFTKVTLPSTLMTIGAGAFRMCQCLQSVNIPEGITEIKDSTFEECYKLANIIIPKKIKKIGSNAFYAYKASKIMTFSWNAPEIASKAFGGVTATCYYPSNNQEWTSSMLQNYGGTLTWVAKIMEDGSGSGESGTGETEDGKGNETGDGKEDGKGDGTGESESEGNTSGGNTSGGTGTGGSSSGESGNTGGTATEKDFGFSAHSLTLNGDIGVNFYLELDETILKDDSAVMEMTIAGKEKTKIKVSDAVAKGYQEVKDTDGNSHQCYKFTCNVYAKQMTDNIVATLKTSSGTWKEVYSVQSYVDKAQNSGNEKLKKLATAMAIYGGYAQILFGYNTNNLAGGSLGDVSAVTKDMLSEYEYVESGAEEGLSFYGTSLLLKEQTTIRMYYQLTEGNIEDYKFAIDGKEVQPIQSGDSNIYYIEMNNIAAQDLEKAHVFTTGSITISNYSALSYVNKALDSEKSSENNKKAAEALYLYWRAAEAYFS